MSWDAKISFGAFSSFCETVAKESSKPRKLAKLKRFVEETRKVCVENGGDSLFPIMRLLLPAIDRQVWGAAQSPLGHPNCHSPHDL